MKELVYVLALGKGKTGQALRAWLGKSCDSSPGLGKCRGCCDCGCRGVEGWARLVNRADP